MSASMKYINRPSSIERKLYDEATQWMVQNVSGYPGLKSFYRFGNITVPGISDLDLLLVFENDVKCIHTGFEGMPEQFKQLYTHGIMAISENHFYKNHHYTLWSDHVLLSGEDLELTWKENKTEAQLTALKIQTAIEFLIANYIDLKIQLVYKTINLRSFLQHMKGIIYDLEFLGITSGSVMKQLQELKFVIQHWFSQTPSDTVLDKWIEHFDKDYESFCNEIFIQHPMYLPLMEQYQVSRNAVLKDSQRLSFQHNGMVLPSIFSVFGKKMMRLQNRFNSFHFGMPIIHQTSLPIIAERFEFLKEMKSYNRKYLPGFMTITTSITSKII
ncbi:MAG: hypothetical protein ABI772_11215 [Bacteroidota bacterium]